MNEESGLKYLVYRDENGRRTLMLLGLDEDRAQKNVRRYAYAPGANNTTYTALAYREAELDIVLMREHIELS